MESRRKMAHFAVRDIEAYGLARRK